MTSKRMRKAICFRPVLLVVWSGPRKASYESASAVTAVTCTHFIQFSLKSFQLKISGQLLTFTVIEHSRVFTCADAFNQCDARKTVKYVLHSSFSVATHHLLSADIILLLSPGDQLRFGDEMHTSPCIYTDGGRMQPSSSQVESFTC